MRFVNCISVVEKKQLAKFLSVRVVMKEHNFWSLPEAKATSSFYMLNSIFLSHRIRAMLSSTTLSKIFWELFFDVLYYPDILMIFLTDFPLACKYWTHNYPNLQCFTWVEHTDHRPLKVDSSLSLQKLSSSEEQSRAS